MGNRKEKIGNRRQMAEVENRKCRGRPCACPAVNSRDQRAEKRKKERACNY